MRATRECHGGAVTGPQGTGKRTDEDGDGAHGSPHATQRGPHLADVRRAVPGRRSVPYRGLSNISYKCIVLGHDEATAGAAHNSNTHSAGAPGLTMELIWEGDEIVARINL